MIKLIGLVAMLVCAAAAVSGSDVIELKDSDFDARIKQYDVALVKFYAPWCGHCKRMAPEFDKASSELIRNDPPVALIKVDCTSETKTCGKHGVNGYPTLKIFKNGEVASDYQGPREADGIVKYMRTKAGPSAKEIKSVDELEKFLNNFEHSIVAFVKSADSTLAAEFKKVADSLAESYRFAYTSEPAVLEKYKHTDEIVIYQPPRLQVKLEATEKVYSGAASTGKIKLFINEELHGLVGHRTQSNAADFKARPLVVVYYNVDYVKDIKGSNYVRNRVIKVAQKIRNEDKLDVNFAISNAEEFRSELGEFGLEDLKPNMKLIMGRGKNDEKYKFDGEYTPENLDKFARDLVAGRLEAYLKSEPIPDESASNEAVRTVVARNFNDVVNDESKDVLIEFYAPWCGHCKSLAPKYEELATKLKSEGDIVIAKMDATANDVPAPYDVRG